jgi:hypothetical protein
MKKYRGMKLESHKPHGKLGNPNPPQTEEFRAKAFKPIGDIPGAFPLGKKVFGLRLPVDCEAYLSQWEDESRVEWLRSLLVTAIREKAEEEGFTYESR